MSDKFAVIFGAGKISRGYIAHLLSCSGYQITFIEKSPILVNLLREKKRYRVSFEDSPENNTIISGFDIITPYERSAIGDLMSIADIGFVSVGGPNLPGVASLIGSGIKEAFASGRIAPLDFIICENYYRPAILLRDLVNQTLNQEEKDWAEKKIGFVETMVHRAVMDPTNEMRLEDPLSLRTQNKWELTADLEAFHGRPPEILGLRLLPRFQDALTRKLFTHNTINAVISYLGYLKGKHYLSEAANDSQILEVVQLASKEISDALCIEFGFDPTDQAEFVAEAMEKFRNKEIKDPLLRSTHDPIRKLAKNDRLVGPATLALKHGIEPKGIVKAIAAALIYDHPEDPEAYNVQAIIAAEGIEKAIERICEIPAKSTLGEMIAQAYEQTRSEY